MTRSKIEFTNTRSILPTMIPINSPSHLRRSTTLGAPSPVQTNATSYHATTAAVNNGTNAEVASFAPLAVPEPATVSVLAFAAGAALLRRRR